MGEMIIVDQTLLPNRVEFLRIRDQTEVWEAIHILRVRGAPAIGIAAGFGAYLAVRESRAEEYEQLLKEFLEAKRYLASARPTAVNLFWALDRMEKRLRSGRDKAIKAIKNDLLVEAEAIKAEDIAMCRAIGENGLSLLEPGMGLLTHCNAGRLAASRYGTALAPIYIGHEKNYGFKVFADETRPLLQGARLTALELMMAGVDVTLLCDSAAAMVMQKGWIQAVLAGCDRIAANGDVANKIGTSGVAILARHYGIPFYILGPTSSIDRQCPTGAQITIEERNPEEVTELWYAKRMAPAGVKVFNPAFDVTPHELIAGIVTERGVARAPFGDVFERMLMEWFVV
ncbi:MAG: S-methyl-5-thioribose-1-phosphate isomerase [Planctomycetes bacterium]|nr:S-methyl-5-thioribose-1-phosphate isomerase [Planctomycetota bacterium]